MNKKYFSESKDSFIKNTVDSPIPHHFYFLCGSKYLPATRQQVKAAISAATQIQGFESKAKVRQIGLDIYITFIHL